MHFFISSFRIKLLMYCSPIEYNGLSKVESQIRQDSRFVIFNFSEIMIIDLALLHSLLCDSVDINFQINNK